MTEESSSKLGTIIRTSVALAILSVGIVGLALMIIHGQPEPPVVEPEKSGDPIALTVPVDVHRDKLDITVDGVVVPHREINVAAEVGGRVVQKTDVCEAGKYVRQGTLLVEIFARDYELEVARLQKELRQAAVSLEELQVEQKNTQELIVLAENSLELQQREVARFETLAKRGDKYVTDSQVDAERRNELNARNALVTLQNQLRTTQARRGRLQAAQELVQANLDKANLNLSRCKITAPIDGMIVKDSVELDAYVSPGTVVATIEDVSQCDVRCNLRMDELKWIWNQACPECETNPQAMVHEYLLPPTATTVVYTLGDQKFEWNGTLSRYDGIGLDEATRTVPCIVVVDRPNQVRLRGNTLSQKTQGPRALVRGMYVQLIIHARPLSTLLEVPENAIKPGNRVWRVRNGRLDVIPVQVVSVMDNLVVIAAKQQTSVVGQKDETLVPGDQVVTGGLKSMHDGMKVRPQLEKR